MLATNQIQNDDSSSSSSEFDEEQAILKFVKKQLPKTMNKYVNDTHGIQFSQTQLDEIQSQTDFPKDLLKKFQNQDLENKKEHLQKTIEEVKMQSNNDDIQFGFDSDQFEDVQLEDQKSDMEQDPLNLTDRINDQISGLRQSVQNEQNILGDISIYEPEPDQHILDLDQLDKIKIKEGFPQDESHEENQIDLDSKRDLNLERSSLCEYEKDEEDKFDGFEQEENKEGDQFSFRVIEEPQQVVIQEQEGVQSETENSVVVRASMRRNEKREENAIWEMVESKNDGLQKQKMKPQEKIKEIGSFILRASTQVIKNQRPRSFPFRTAAKVSVENSDENLNLITVDFKKQSFGEAQWQIKNDSQVDWSYMANPISDNLKNSIFKENKKFNLHPVWSHQNTKINIKEFDYDFLKANETLTIKLNLDFSGLQDKQITQKAFMFKIVDEKKRIVGDPKKDNLILFVKVLNDSNEPVANEDMCLGLASLLLDEGYCDSFDRCFKAVTCCHGNIEEARTLLQNVMAIENQYQ